MSVATKLAVALVRLVERREDAAAAEHAQWCLEGLRVPPQLTPSWSSALSRARYVQCDRNDVSYTSAYPTSSMWTRIYTIYPDHERIHGNTSSPAFLFGRFSTGRYALLVKDNLVNGTLFHAAQINNIARGVCSLSASIITDRITP